MCPLDGRWQTDCSDAAEGKLRGTDRSWGLTPICYQKWVPHPRRVFVFAARVGTNSLGRVADWYEAALPPLVGLVGNSFREDFQNQTNYRDESLSVRARTKLKDLARLHIRMDA